MEDEENAIEVIKQALVRKSCRFIIDIIFQVSAPQGLDHANAMADSFVKWFYSLINSTLYNSGCFGSLLKNKEKVLDVDYFYRCCV